MTEAVQEKGLVPKLRFPEFRERWAAVPLSGTAYMIADRVGDDDCIPLSITSGIGLVSQVEKFGRTIAGGQYKNYIRLQTGDFAYNKSSTKSNPEGFIARYSGTEPAAVPSSIFTCFRVNAQRVDPRLLKFFFESNLHGNFLRQRLSVGARAHGSLNIADADLLETPIPLPLGSSALTEQRKIAECLESLDELIAAEMEKLEALKRHKKGLLQQLFPAEGETTPRLRFPCYTSQWQRTPLAPMLSESPSYGLNAPATGYRADLPLYLRITDIDEEGRYIRSGQASVAGRVTADDYLQPGDIAVARTGASVGKSFLCDGKDGPFVYAGFLIRLRTDPSKLLPELLAQWLRSDEYWRWVTLTSARSGQPGVNGTEYASATMPVPIGSLAMQEQRDVANCLSAEDAIMSSLREKLDNLRKHKAALMQQLFPSLEETEP